MSVRVNPTSPWRVVGSQLTLDGRPVADVEAPPMPSYYLQTLTNGKTVMETAPTIQWGYLIYLTVLRLCQYFGAKEECRFCDINHNWRQHKQAGRPYTGIKPVEDVLEALAIIDEHDVEKASHAYTLTGGSVTSKVDGLAEADFYGRYAQAIEERFPGRWIGKVVAQALPRADVQRYKDYGITIYHPNYEVWDERLFSIICPGKERYVGRAEWHRRILDSAEVFGPRYVIPNFVAGVEMAKPFGFATPEEAVASTVVGPRLLHVARDHAAVHDLVPGADDAARHRQPRGRAARVPRPAARGVPRDARAPRAAAAARLRQVRRRERGLLGQLVHGRARAGGRGGLTRIDVDEARRALALGERRGAEGARPGAAGAVPPSRPCDLHGHADHQLHERLRCPV